jgi:putative transposase
MPRAPSKIMPDNNIVEQDHRAIKRIMRPMLGFKSTHCTRILLTGIETAHLIRKGQLGGPKEKVASAAKQFYSLAY